VPPGHEEKVTESALIQGLIHMWMAFDVGVKIPTWPTHKNIDPKGSITSRKLEVPEEGATRKADEAEQGPLLGEATPEE
jgi:hypothetical protein